MRVAGVIAVSALVAGISLLTLSPRLDHSFPSMVDDWYAIDRVPGQVVDALTLRRPEEQRYRPGWIVWSALQWHTLGAPDDLAAPLVWWVLRVLVFVAGIVAAAVVAAGRSPPTRAGRIARLALAGAAALVVVTIPVFAVDLARNGPQEPLMIGLMCGGGAILAAAIGRALDGRVTDGRLALLGGLGALAFGAGAAQKETSICVLALVPFLWAATRDERGTLAALSDRTQRTTWALVALAALPLLPMTVRTAQLALAPTRVYNAEPGHGLLAKTQALLEQMGKTLESRVPVFLVGAAIALLVVLALTRRLEIVSAGFLVTGLAFLVFAGQVVVAPSRYYLPTVTLAALAVVRLAARIRSVRVEVLAVVLLVALAAPQIRDAHGLVDVLVRGNRAQEQMVRVVGGLRAAGCEVRLAGNEVELREALPVLARIADPKPIACGDERRMVAVLSWYLGESPTDPAIVACGPAPRVVFRNDIGRVVACRS
jgi:hypothetical protein